jgi:hypothetical protein
VELVQQGKSKKEKGKRKNTYVAGFLAIFDGSFISKRPVLVLCHANFDELRNPRQLL